MLMIKLYATEIIAIDPRDGEFKIWAGPNVPARGFDEARAYCESHGLGYCRVVGELVGESPDHLKFVQAFPLIEAGQRN